MLEKKALVFFEKQNSLQTGETLVVGFSGGADSLALLHFLWKNQSVLGITPQAVHIHHGLRGEEADRDLDFCKNFCENRQISFVLYSFDVKREAKKRGIGTEETGRLLRYQSFRKEAEKKGGKIAVAHHENDQGETVLLNLFRGTGLRGLCGMKPVEGDILRPLLFCTRQEIEDYCQRENLSFCTDATNLEQDYTRNRIRNQILPMVQNEINENAISHIAQTAEILQGEEDFLTTTTKEWFEKIVKEKEPQRLVFSLPNFLDCHLSIQRRVIKLGIATLLGGEKDIIFSHVQQVFELFYGQTGKESHLPKGLVARRSYETVVLSFLAEQAKKYEYPLSLDVPMFIEEMGKYVEISLEEKNRQNCKGLCTKVFDYDKIDKILSCRNRQQGDRIFLDETHSKKIKDFFIDEKIPKDQRDKIPLIATKEEVLWMIGHRLSGKYRVCTQTKRKLYIQIWEEETNERTD